MIDASTRGVVSQAMPSRRLREHKIFGYLTPAETRQRHQQALAA
ncbi:hypothetical protein [Streptomyces sp. NPDC047981]